MKRCWRDHGLTEEGARRADRIVEAMVALVADAGSEIAQIALYEARFRVEELPTRTKAYQRQYMKTI